MIVPIKNCLHLFLLRRSSLEVRVPLIHLGLVTSTLEIALANILWDVLVLISTLEIVLANIFRDVLFPGCTRTIECDGCPSMQQSGLSLPFVFVFLLHDLLSFLSHRRFCIWNQHYLGWKIFCLCLSFSRDMSLWETDLKNLLNHTLLSIPRSSLIRTTFGVHISFFPDSHLKESCTPQIFRFTWRILSHRNAVLRDETTCACFRLQKKLGEELSWALICGTNSCVKCNKVKNSVLSCNMN